jgi:bifunctional oligoribonuclease and PAP phosphatase NrnA
MMSLEKVIAKIKTNKRFLISAHTSLEGDALGSELAFCSLIQKMGKDAFIVNEDPVPYGYDFLPGLENIRQFSGRMKAADFDCLAILDCSDPGRTGEVYKMNKGNKPVINIDHHISNRQFGDANWVDPRASSCSEMIYKLYKKTSVPLDKESALALYTGILTDTGSFRYTNTTSYTHRAVSELLKFNLDVPQIYKNVYENMPLADARLLGSILPTLKCEAAGRVAWFEIKRGALRHKKISFDLGENILSFARGIKGVEVVAIFRENRGVKNEIRVNFRSQGKVDVNKIASLFGGGGHPTASGATIRGDIESVRKKVLSKIRASL